MSKKQSIDTFGDSLEVIRDYNRYIQFKGGTPLRHKARVLTQSGRYNYNQILSVSTRIETNYAIITIEGDIEFCRNFHPEYRNDYQVFKSFSNGMIQISDTEDIWGNPITFDISFVE